MKIVSSIFVVSKFEKKDLFFMTNFIFKILFSSLG